MTVENQDAVERAKADIAEYDRKINTIMSEEARLESQRLQMESERARIQAFVEMYDRYASDKKPSVVADAAVKRFRPRPIPTVERKPVNLPPMSEMITVALKDAAERGTSGLEPKEITDFIRGRSQKARPLAQLLGVCRAWVN